MHNHIYTTYQMSKARERDRESNILYHGGFFSCSFTSPGEKFDTLFCKSNDIR